MQENQQVVATDRPLDSLEALVKFPSGLLLLAYSCFRNIQISDSVLNEFPL